jgi:pimeloyl-ACP methyl ester carboxylesterase
VGTSCAYIGERFTVIAPDLPGIGDSAIPANGLEMQTRLFACTLARSFGVEKARVVGHDIGLMACKLAASNVTVIVVKDSGHWLQEERPNETTDALVGFL